MIAIAVLGSIISALAQSLVPRPGIRALFAPSGMYRVDIGATRQQIQQAWRILKLRRK